MHRRDGAEGRREKWVTITSVAPRAEDTQAQHGPGDRVLIG